MSDGGRTIVVNERYFGESGSGPGQFKMPRFICTLPNGNICVSDFLNQRLQILTPSGRLEATIGEQGNTPGKLCGPSGVFCEGDHIFVAEGGNHRLQKLTLADGKAVSRAGSHGKGNNNMWCPQGLAIAKRFTASPEDVPRSDLFAADSINGRVVVYDVANLEFLRTFGSRGSKPGELMYPSGIAIRDEEVFVSDFGNHRISVFSKRGNFERSFGSRGTALGQLNEPRGVAIVKGWVVVTESKRISVFSPAGEPQQILQVPGTGQLWGCCAAEIDGESKVLVTDVRPGNAKVIVLKVLGSAHDEGMSVADMAAKKAALKKEAEEEKMREWQAQREAKTK